VLYPRELLVETTDKVTTPALLATPAAPAKKSYANALSYSPSLDARAEHVYYSHRFVSRNTRPRDRKHALDGSRIRVAYAACLNADADIAGSWINQRLSRQFEFPGTDGVNSLVGYVVGHRVSPSGRKNRLVRQ
jgi:hypothetical protein